MATKDISDVQVLLAYRKAKEIDFDKWPYEFLMEWTNQPQKVCFRAMERAYDRGYLECGVSLRTGWLTKKGDEYLYLMAAQ